MLSEANIIKQFHKGDNSVFKQIFDKYYLPLRSFAYHFVEDDAITDDFVQDAFIKIWERRSDFNSVLTLKSFLYTTVKNSCLDHIKHQNIQTRNEAKIIMSLTANQENYLVLEEEIHALIYQSIKNLSVQSRQIVLETMRGLSNAEIAKEMDISINTVKTLKLRAYKRLREQLSGLDWFLSILFF